MGGMGGRGGRGGMGGRNLPVTGDSYFCTSERTLATDEDEDDNDDEDDRDADEDDNRDDGGGRDVEDDSNEEGLKKIINHLFPPPPSLSQHPSSSHPLSLLSSSYLPLSSLPPLKHTLHSTV